MTALIEQLRLSTAESLRFAIHDYFRPILDLGRWARSVARLPLLLERENAAISSVSRIQEEQGAELRDIAHAVVVAHKELSELQVKIGKVHDHQVQSNLSADFERLERKLESLGQRHIEQAISRFFSLAESMRLRGNTSRALGVLELADRVAERHKSPMQPYVWFNIGEAFYEKSDEKNAELYFSKVISGSDADEVIAAAYSRLALIRYTVHQLPEATSFAERAVNIYERLGNKTSIYRTYVQLVSSLFEQGKVREATEILRRANQISAATGETLSPYRWTDQG